MDLVRGVITTSALRSSERVEPDDIIDVKVVETYNETKGVIIMVISNHQNMNSVLVYVLPLDHGISGEDNRIILPSRGGPVTNVDV